MNEKHFYAEKRPESIKRRIGAGLSRHGRRAGRLRVLLLLHKGVQGVAGLGEHLRHQFDDAVGGLVVLGGQQAHAVAVDHQKAHGAYTHAGAGAAGKGQRGIGGGAVVTLAMALPPLQILLDSLFRRLRSLRVHLLLSDKD